MKLKPMKCFECGGKISDESRMLHIEDGDFIHEECKNLFEKNRQEFFDNIGDDSWFDSWFQN